MDTTIDQYWEKRYNVRLIVEQDDTPVRGNAIASGDDEEDRKYEDLILARLATGDVWAWAQVEVQVTLPDGRTGSARLGGCSYKDEADFKEPGGYYRDLIDGAIEDAESNPVLVNAYEQRKFLEDLLSFLLFTYRRNDMDDTRKLKSIVDTLAHDINGTLDGDEFFSPRVSGYSEKFPVL